MTQPTPWRYLERGDAGDEESHREMRVWGREGRQRKEGMYTGRDVGKIYIKKHGIKPAKCLWQDGAAPRPGHSSLSDGESN